MMPIFITQHVVLSGLLILVLWSMLVPDLLCLIKGNMILTLILFSSGPVPGL